MSKVTAFLFFVTVLLGTTFVVKGPELNSASFIYNTKLSIKTQPASTFFVESTKPEELKKAFTDSNSIGKKIRILIVPGHDTEYWGTEFNGLKEADVTLKISKYLSDFFSQDGRFNVMTTRNDDGYLPVFQNYFRDNKSEIVKFIQSKKAVMNSLVNSGEVKKSTSNIIHNTAPDVVTQRLYGINMWANENDVDLVLHIHLNDYPGRKAKRAGEYTGFSIYVPEHQYSNARASKDIAKFVSERLENIYDESNLPKEDAIVEDQDLIAIGSFNTLDPASLLIEYGYIYEPQFNDSKIRNLVAKELAAKTYIGVVDFFDQNKQQIVGKYESTLLPFSWKSSIVNGTKFDESTLSLQAALIKEGVYPPSKFEMRDCPLAGTYGQCTKGAIAQFQKKYNISDSPGLLGKSTREKLNELYGS